MYYLVKPTNTTFIEAVKKAASDVITEVINVHIDNSTLDYICDFANLFPVDMWMLQLLQSVVNNKINMEAFISEHLILTNVKKLLLEETALIKRIGRVPESNGINMKLFFKSGWFLYSMHLQ